LVAADVLQVDAVRIAAIQAHVREHLDAEFVQARRRVVPHIERQGLSGGNPADGKAHRPSELRQVFGDTDADPIAAPIYDQYRLADGCPLTAQHLPGIHDL